MTWTLSFQSPQYKFCILMSGPGRTGHNMIRPGYILMTCRFCFHCNHPRNFLFNHSSRIRERPLPFACYSNAGPAGAAASPATPKSRHTRLAGSAVRALAGSQ